MPPNRPNPQDDEALPGEPTQWKEGDVASLRYHKCIDAIAAGNWVAASKRMKGLPGSLKDLAREMLILSKRARELLAKDDVRGVERLLPDCIVKTIEDAIREQLGLRILDETEDESASLPESQEAMPGHLEGETRVVADLRREVKKALRPANKRINAPDLRDHIEQVLRKRLSASPVILEEDFSTHVDRIVQIGKDLKWDEFMKMTTGNTLPLNYVTIALLFLLLRAADHPDSVLTPENLARTINCKANTVVTSLTWVKEPLRRAGLRILHIGERLAVCREGR